MNNIHIRRLVKALATARAASDALTAEVKNAEKAMYDTEAGKTWLAAKEQLAPLKKEEAAIREQIQQAAFAVDDAFPKSKPHPAVTVTHGRYCLEPADGETINPVHVAAWAMIYAPDALRVDDAALSLAIEAYWEKYDNDALRLLNGIPGGRIAIKRGLRIDTDLSFWINDAVEPDSEPEPDTNVIDSPNEFFIPF